MTRLRSLHGTAPRFRQNNRPTWMSDMVFLSGISLAILPHGDQLKLLTIIKVYVNVVWPSPLLVLTDQSCGDHKTQPKKLISLLIKSDRCTWFTFDDEQLLWGDKPQDTIKRLHTLGVKTVVQKTWCWRLLDQWKPRRYASKSHGTTPRPETVVDSTSAGDSFNGGFLSCLYLAGGSVSRSLPTR